MPLQDACTFVSRMKEDHTFRNKALATSVPEDLVSFLQTEDLMFDKRELVCAMAKCMADMEQQMDR